MKMRKAQINQIFVYIIAIVVLSLILFFGYRAIRDVGQQSEEAFYAQFQRQIKADISRAASDYGSSFLFEYELPANYDSICFADSTLIGKTGTSLTGEGLTASAYAIIYDSVESGSDNNVFLYPEGTESFYAGKLEVDIEGKKFGCIEKAGTRVKIRMEGLGDRTKIIG